MLTQANVLLHDTWYWNVNLILLLVCSRLNNQTITFQVLLNTISFGHLCGTNQNFGYSNKKFRHTASRYFIRIITTCLIHLLKSLIPAKDRYLGKVGQMVVLIKTQRYQGGKTVFSFIIYVYLLISWKNLINLFTDFEHLFCFCFIFK